MWVQGTCGGGQDRTVRTIHSQPREVTRRLWRCGLLPNYFRHLFTFPGRDAYYCDQRVESSADPLSTLLILYHHFSNQLDLGRPLYATRHSSFK